MPQPSRLDLFLADTLEPRRRPPDITTIAGFAFGLALLALAIGVSGSAAAFLDLPSLLIVFGGTLSAVAVAFSTGDVAATAGAVCRAFGRAGTAPRSIAVQLIAVAEYARQAGILALDDLPRPIAGTSFLDKALDIVVDAGEATDIEAILRSRLAAEADAQCRSVIVLRKAAETAPAMGLIGTLVGLVQMLRQLDQPSAIGPGMAVALLTTFYGAVLGHMVFAPLAGKLERQNAADALANEMCILTALSISRRENPRRLEAALNSVLPPSDRVRVFD